MFIKKNPKVTDLAKYFVLSECLDKAYSPETALASNVNDLKKVKSLALKYTTKRIEKEIDTLAKNQLFIDCIKTKEYVDIDMLESAVYQGKVDAKILSDCKEVSTTYRLNIYKNKE